MSAGPVAGNDDDNKSNSKSITKVSALRAKVMNEAKKITRDSSVKKSHFRSSF